MKRRVLIVVQNLPVPFDRRVWLEATTLARAGYRITVICPKMKSFRAAHEVLEDVEIFRYHLPVQGRSALGFAVEFAWCFLMTAALSLRVAVVGRGFDVLHVCNPPETYWPLAAFWRLLGKRFVFDHHDLSPEMFTVKFGRRPLLHRMLLLNERLTFRLANLVLTTNESHKEIALRRGGKRPHDVHVVRSGPDTGRLQVREKDPATAGGFRYLVAYLGEICKQDGVEHLVRAMQILRDDYGRDDVGCVFIGGGPHQPEVARYASDLGLDTCCRFVGCVSDDELSTILSSADIGVDPDPKNEWSDRSTMNKIGEYMFFGLPVVAYDLRETRVSAGEAGLYAEANDERSLARCIATLLDDPAARDRMGETGKARIRNALGWEHSVPVLLAAYRGLF